MKNIKSKVDAMDLEKSIIKKPKIKSAVKIKKMSY